MSDDVKQAIADALVREWGAAWHMRPGQHVEDVAEVAFDAAVEAGMAPPDEVERLREREQELLDRWTSEKAARESAERALTRVRRLRAALDGDDDE